MKNDEIFYTVSDLAAELNVPRTTINDWLKKFDRFIDFETKGRRKIYTAESLKVLRLISSARDKGTGIAELEKELASCCAVRPEISDLSAGTTAVDNTVQQMEQKTECTENLPAIPIDLNSFFRDFERNEHTRIRHHRRGFLLISVLLILLLSAACATLFLLAQLLTLKDASKTLEQRLAASKRETELMRKKTEQEFRLIARKVEKAGSDNAAAAETLRQQLAEQRKRFSAVFQKLEKTDQLREKEIKRLEREILRLEKKNQQLQSSLKAATEKLQKTQSSLKKAEQREKTLQKKLKISGSKILELEKKQKKAKEKSKPVPAAPVENKAVKK